MPVTDYLLSTPAETSTPITVIKTSDFETWRDKQKAELQNWISANDFKGKAGSFLLSPDKKGTIAEIILAVSDSDTMWDFAALPSKLPLGTYELKGDVSKEDADQACLGWALGCYKFDWYKKSTQDFASLVLPKNTDSDTVSALAEGIELTRDLINIPAGDMGPEELAGAAIDLADQFKAKCKVIKDDDLLKENLAAIHMVGKGAADDRRPCLIDLNWGKKKDPMITLVGKGVCFDTGGLDIKPAQFMKQMKKDMGGAAHVLGIAKAIMMAKLPVRLRVLIPAVENAVSDKAMRPLDVVTARNGTTIEIGHTDAEGRVVLADALALACEEKPKMIIDFATLTGAARVALGTELPALFSNSDDLANDLLDASTATKDAMWRLPLWKPYRSAIDGKTADISNEANMPYGGAITAALFLEEFITEGTSWAHLDVMGWNTSSKAGRPEGGEAMGLRATFEMIKKTVS